MDCIACFSKFGWTYQSLKISYSYITHTMYNLFFLNFIQLARCGTQANTEHIIVRTQIYIPSLPDLALDLMMSDRHFLQTLCEHGSMRGSAYSSRHTGHVRSSSILKYDRSVHNSYNDS